MKSAYSFLGSGALVALLGLRMALRTSSAYGSKGLAWAVGLFLIVGLVFGAVRTARSIRSLPPEVCQRAILYLVGSALIFVYLAFALPTMAVR